MGQQFDPVAATAAYLAQLPPEAHAKAQAYTQGGHWTLLWGALIAVLVAWLVLKSGVLVRLRGRIESRRARPWLAAMAVLALDAVLETALNLPWSAYEDWWREKSYGLTSQSFGGWIGEFAVMQVLAIPITVLLLSLLYWMIRWAPRTWFVWGGGLVVVFFGLILIVSPIFIQPLFNSYTPAPAGPVRDAIVKMAEANGVPHNKIYIYDGSKQSNRYTANVSGLFGTAQISMSDVMFAKGADLAEVRGVVGHEMGHYKQMHAIWIALAYGLIVMTGLFLTDRLFPVVASLAGAEGVKGIADPAGFPVMAMILAVLALLGTPLFSAVSRTTEIQADQYSLTHVGEPDGLAKALVKTIEYRAATPSKLEELLFYSHPSVGNRVRMAMDWKAEQMAKAPAQP